MKIAPASSALFVLAFAAPAAHAATLSFGVVTPNQKVRPMDAPATSPSASIKAAKNENESFQLVFTAPAGAVTGVSVKLSTPLVGPDNAAIGGDNVVLYRAAYYDVGTPSNAEGAAGLWPDPLVPDVDVYFGEKRNAFPFDVPMGESRVVWVDVLVPATAQAGDYAGELEIDVGGAAQGTVPVKLHVGTFSLPSTSSLGSLFGMGWADPCVAHTGDNYCKDANGDDTADALRALYVRSALEHRFTISPIDFQPPVAAGDQPAFEKYLLPYITGTGVCRLAGAKVTSVVIDGGNADLEKWVDYSKAKGFFDRLLYYPVDEPGMNAATWNKFSADSDALHAVDAAARILITSSIQDSNAAGTTDKIDVFIPVIDQIENRPGTDYAGNQRPLYDAWLAAKPGRAIWSYQSCDEHGCGACGDTSPDPAYSGWPNRVVDSSAVQDRAFPWHAFRYDLSGELYFDTTYQLTTAWNDNGQCAFSGSGDGTIFYAGKPSIVGGTSDIPIESIRMKMMREGYEDYEYLKLAAAIDPAKAKSIADGLFPHTYESAQPPAKLEAARDALFAMLDMPSSPTGAGGAGTSSTSSSAATSTAGAGGASGAGGDTSKNGGGGDASGSTDANGCGCRAAGGSAPPAWLFVAIAGGLGASARRRRRSKGPIFGESR